MKVLQLISSGGMYGAEAVVLNLARSLNHARHHTVLGVFSNTAGGDVQLHHEAVAQGLESHLLPCHGQFDRKMFAHLRQVVADGAFDIVHTHGYKADVYAFLALRKFGVPLVSTCHSWLDNNAKVRAYGAADRFVLRSFASVVAVSEAIRTTLVRSGVHRDRVRLIPNGIDLTPYAAAANQATEPGHADQLTRVGLIGRLAPEKGIDLFLRAVALVLKQHPRVQFVIAGDGPERGSLEALSLKLQLPANVTFLGRCNHIPDLLASLDFVVSASRSEGLPIAILETMASGRALIATTVGEIPMVLDGGKAGVLIPPEDIGALAEAMTLLLKDPGLRQRLAHAARERVLAHFSADRMAQDYLTFYAEALALKHQAGVL